VTLLGLVMAILLAFLFAVLLALLFSLRCRLPTFKASRFVSWTITRSDGGYFLAISMKKKRNKLVKLEKDSAIKTRIS